MNFPDSKELKCLLELKADQYNRPEFLESDPVQIPHRFSSPGDIEISGFFSSVLAWGQRKTIINKSLELMRLMDHKPYEFVMHAKNRDLRRFEHFCHRTFNATDTLYFLHALRNIYSQQGGLQKVFENGFSTDHSAAGAIIHFRKLFLSYGAPERTKKHVPDILRGSAAKRLNLFLRWMVRDDGRGVDFGIWNTIRPAWLCIPLDLHSGNSARKLNLLVRKQNDWKAVQELTLKLAELDPEDPVKFDFALFGMGAFDQGIA
jgi:uncharacterized protein (TIGR02757 family)